MDELNRLAVKSDQLDDIVTDAGLTLASNANNGGVSEQVRFLTSVCDWSTEEILNELKRR